jgi:hypothetical protein
MNLTPSLRTAACGRLSNNLIIGCSTNAAWILLSAAAHIAEWPISSRVSIKAVVVLSSRSLASFCHISRVADHSEVRRTLYIALVWGSHESINEDYFSEF